MSPDLRPSLQVGEHECKNRAARRYTQHAPKSARRTAPDEGGRPAARPSWRDNCYARWQVSPKGLSKYTNSGSSKLVSAKRRFYFDRRSTERPLEKLKRRMPQLPLQGKTRHAHSLRCFARSSTCGLRRSLFAARGALGTDCLLCRLLASRTASPLRTSARLPRQRSVRRCCRTLALQSIGSGSRALCIRLPALGRSLRALLSWRRGNLHARPSRLRQPDCDRLLRRPGAVLSFAHVLDFFVHVRAGFCRR